MACWSICPSLFFWLLVRAWYALGHVWFCAWWTGLTLFPFVEYRKFRLTFFRCFSRMVLLIAWFVSVRCWATFACCPSWWSFWGVWGDSCVVVRDLTIFPCSVDSLSAVLEWDATFLCVRAICPICSHNTCTLHLLCVAHSKYSLSRPSVSHLHDFHSSGARICVWVPEVGSTDNTDYHSILWLVCSIRTALPVWPRVHTTGCGDNTHSRILRWSRQLTWARPLHWVQSVLTLRSTVRVHPRRGHWSMLLQYPPYHSILIWGAPLGNKAPQISFTNFPARSIDMSLTTSIGSKPNAFDVVFNAVTAWPKQICVSLPHMQALHVIWCHPH